MLRLLPTSAYIIPFHPHAKSLPTSSFKYFKNTAYNTAKLMPNAYQILALLVLKSFLAHLHNSEVLLNGYQMCTQYLPRTTAKAVSRSAYLSQKQVLNNCLNIYQMSAYVW